MSCSPSSSSLPRAPRVTRPEHIRAQAAASMAEMVADGSSIYAAGTALKLTRGEAVSTWRRVCADLGPQAS